MSDNLTGAPRTLNRTTGRSSTATDGSSALAVAHAESRPRPPLRVVPTARSGQTTVDAVPPPPVRLLLRGLLEVLGGWRPAAQMALRVSPEIAADLLARPRRPGAAPAPQVVRLRAMRVSEHVVETCAVLRRGHRCRALAMRLEYGDHGWLVTRLQVG